MYISQPMAIRDKMETDSTDSAVLSCDDMFLREWFYKYRNMTVTWGIGPMPSLVQMEHASSEACIAVLKSQALQGFGKVGAAGRQAFFEQRSS